MANFSVNQNRQFYVANTVNNTAVATAEGTKVTSQSNAGTIRLAADASKDNIYFEYKGADNLMRSDIIPINNILHAKATAAKSMQHALKQATVVLDDTVNDGAPISGQDYILRVEINPYVGMSDEEPYFKYGMVHAYAKMTASDFYKKLAISLAKNFSRELEPMLSFALKTADSSEEVTAYTKEASLTGTYTGVILTEVEQEWRLGIKEQGFVNFKVVPTTVLFEGDEVTWGTVTTADSSTIINNGKKIADLEYFCMGERGDVYRGVGFPNNIPTKYLVDPDKEYNTLDIHYYYAGPNEGPQKSEKTITVVSSTASDLNNIIKRFNSLTGSSIDEL